jgi:hypothetical protein
MARVVPVLSSKRPSECKFPESGPGDSVPPKTTVRTAAAWLRNRDCRAEGTTPRRTGNAQPTRCPDEIRGSDGEWQLQSRGFRWCLLEHGSVLIACCDAYAIVVFQRASRGWIPTGHAGGLRLLVPNSSRRVMEAISGITLHVKDPTPHLSLAAGKQLHPSGSHRESLSRVRVIRPARRDPAARVRQGSLKTAGLRSDPHRTTQEPTTWSPHFSAPVLGRRALIYIEP